MNAERKEKEVDYKTLYEQERLDHDALKARIEAGLLGRWCDEHHCVHDTNLDLRKQRLAFLGDTLSWLGDRYAWELFRGDK